MTRYRIAIVCGHFLPEMGYLEVDLARGLHRAGHEVHVITSDVIPRYVDFDAKKKQKAHDTDHEAYEIHRLKSIVSIGQMVICHGLKKELERLSPELVLVIGLGKRFPDPVFSMQGPWKLASFIGDNSKSYQRKRTLIDKSFKDPVYKRAVMKSDKIFSYTAESKQIVSSYLHTAGRSRLYENCEEIRLGVDEHIFFFDEALRLKKRKEWGIKPDERIGITATRCSPEKNISLLLDKVNQSISDGLLDQFHLVGLSDNEYSRLMRTKHADLAQSEKIVLHDMKPQSEMNALLNMADIGISLRPAISIQQALGTGLPLILPKEDSLSHLSGKYHCQFQDLTNLDLSIDINQDERAASASLASSDFGLHALCERIMASMALIDCKLTLIRRV